MSHRVNRGRWWPALVVAVVMGGAVGVPLLAEGVAHAVPSCTETFTNADSNLSFNDANNWSPADVPGSTDVACLGGYTVTLSGSSADVGALEGGALVADANLTLSDASTTSVLTGFELNADFGGSSTATLDVDGDMTWGSGTSDAQIDDDGGPAISQSSGFTFDIDGTGQVYDLGGSTTTQSPITVNDQDFIAANNPTISTTSSITFVPQTYDGNGGGGVDMVTPAVIFTGSTNLTDFNLIITGTTSSITGTDDALAANDLTIDDGASLTIPANDTWTTENDSNDTVAGTLGGDGEFVNVGATTTVTGTLDPGSIDVTGGALDLDEGATVSTGEFEIDGGGVDLATDMSSTSFDEYGGFLTAAAANPTLTLTGPGEWTQGEIDGDGGDSLTISQGAGTSFTVSGTAQAYLIGDTISSQSPIAIDSSGMITTTNGPIAAAVTTTSTLSFGNGDVVGQGGAVFTAAGLAAHGDPAVYGLANNQLVLTGGTTTVPTGTTLEACNLELNGGDLRLDGTLDMNGCSPPSVVESGTLSGTGTITGALTTTGSGTVEPGDAGAPGTLHVDEEFTDAGNLTIVMDSSTDYGTIAAYADTLTGDVTMDPVSYTPAVGTTFTVATGPDIVTGTPTLLPAGHYGGAVVPGYSYVVTAEAKPGAPTITTATGGDQQATITFTAPGSTGGTPITGYTVTATDHTDSARGGETCSPTGDDLYCTVMGLTNGDHYTFTVVATNALGPGTASTASAVVIPSTIPDAPTDAVARWGDASATVSWTPPTDDGGAAVTSYTVTATDGTTPSNGGQTCTVTVTASSKDQCTVTGLTNGDSYTYTVVATNQSGPSAPSDPTAAVIPTPPPALTITPARLVLPRQTSGTTTCRVTILTAVSCSVVVTGPKGVVIARGVATSGGTSSLTVTVKVTGAGAKLAAPVGGVRGTLVATVVLTNGESLTATGTLQLVEQSSKITLSSGILFASGSSTVSAAGKKAIKALGVSIKGASLAECDGYTDNVGSAAANLKLGLARAKAVCAILAPYVKRTKSVSYGEADPVATNGTPAGRAKNRRVVIKVTI